MRGRDDQRGGLNEARSEERESRQRRDETEPTPRPVGRPPATGEPRDARIELRVTRSEHAAIIAAGGSEWVRRLIRAALERQAAGR